MFDDDYYIKILSYISSMQNIKFMAGIPCTDLIGLYNNIDPSKFLYIPAISTNSAMNMVNGATLLKGKGILITPDEELEKMDLSFNIKNNIELYIITNKKVKLKSKFIHFLLYKGKEKELDIFFNKSEKLIKVMVI